MEIKPGTKIRLNKTKEMVISINEDNETGDYAVLTLEKGITGTIVEHKEFSDYLINIPVFNGVSISFVAESSYHFETLE